MIVSVYQQQNQSINIVMAHSLVYQNIVCMKMIFMTACKFLYITTKTAMMYPNWKKCTVELPYEMIWCGQ